MDKYIRRSDGDTAIDKWINGVFQANSVFRKTENDWNMAYLARVGKFLHSFQPYCHVKFCINTFMKTVEGSPKGSLSWKFDLSSTNLVILQATVSCPGTTFEDGEIVWKICGSDHCQILENGK